MATASPRFTNDPTIPAVILRMRWQLAALAFDAKMLRLGLALKANFDPNQPRVPAGRPDGGQWTRVEGYAREGDRELQRIAQSEPQRPYTVNLNEEELRGGHTKRVHIGKTDAELIDVLNRDWRKVWAGGAEIFFFRPAQGSFLSLEAANDFVNRVLEANRDRVDLVAAGQVDHIIVERRFGYVTGKEAFRAEGRAAARIRKTYGVRVVIKHDPSRPRGYRVHTAFPINEYFADLN